MLSTSFKNIKICYQYWPWKLSNYTLYGLAEKNPWNGTYKYSHLAMFILFSPDHQPFSICHTFVFSQFTWEAFSSQEIHSILLSFFLLSSLLYSIVLSLLLFLSVSPSYARVSSVFVIPSQCSLCSSPFLFSPLCKKGVSSKKEGSKLEGWS